ncbi:hypothetical protein [Thalassovita taeanensis]|uniref:Glycosyltransferase involved in cell wall bisynthesis n=1 Tax=Thalassovita taeanensis TaxID=657014 RepID=A0A1H9KXC1_9RHOB|nr:hypothetical protein [Thalassovita taeanensis]SER03517.1 Glycosyltransferase involved in cell wall bisynthesis [Thalassovita taeanensis]
MNDFDPKKTCVVIGNGPSLRGFDLHRLNGFSTLGMNAAYRYWDRIGWYPSYYACLDDQVIRSHHTEIERLYRDGLVKKLFLHRGFFEHHPHRIGNPDFVIFDQTSRHWYPRNAQKLGLPPLFDEPAFRISDTSKITTGSHAVRFVANMGYRQLLLMGIDLRYVEILPEAEPTEGVGLKIARTPKQNPNYFFDGYQKAGDLYNIPNPAAHQGDLHPRAFELVAKDFETNELECQIYNTNPKSTLSDRNVFPLMPIDKALGESRLGAVFVPCNFREVDDILTNFKLWASVELSPSVEPEMAQRPMLVFVFNNVSGREHQPAIEKAFAETGMERFFRGPAFEYLQLEGKTDLYQRDYTKEVGGEGFKSGPNNQFFRSMDCMAKYGHYSFLMEVDCLPLRRGWLERLRTIVDGAEDFWILGSAYRGGEMLSKANTRHINGNAIYATGDPDFQAFIAEFWEPQSWGMIRDVDKRLAYDCILEILFSEDALRDPERLALWKSLAHRFRYTEWTQNISAASDLKATDGALIKRLREAFPRIDMMHNRVAQKLMVEALSTDALTERPKVSRGKTRHAVPRLLVFDMTAIGNGTATGEIKANFLAKWPDEALLQFVTDGPDGLASIQRRDGRYVRTRVDTAKALEMIDAFKPEAILYRPTPKTAPLHRLAMAEIDRLGVPVINWIMDDWPARMEIEASADWDAMRPDLLNLIARSSANLSICEKMSAAFAERYACAFRPLANGIDPADWPLLRRPERRTFVIRYAGGIAPDMNRASLLRVAEAVDILAKSGLDIRFEISTQSWWKKECDPLFASFPSTTLELADKTIPEYRRWISEADLLLIAYNFDETSLRYVQYSMANKMPECLASGAAVLAHGPMGTATIEYLSGDGIAKVVAESDVVALSAAIKELYETPETRLGIAAAGRARAVERHNIHKLREVFADIISQAVKSASTSSLAAPALRSFVPTDATGVDQASALREDIVILSAEILLGRRPLTALNSDTSIAEVIKRAETELAADDPALVHLQRVRRLYQPGSAAHPRA